jgi:hypothetical protein
MLLTIMVWRSWQVRCVVVDECKGTKLTARRPANPRQRRSAHSVCRAIQPSTNKLFVRLLVFKLEVSRALKSHVEILLDSSSLSKPQHNLRLRTST